MWLKLVLVILYVMVLFVLARILETVTWVESGNISRRLLDPMTMSVLKLKALLEQRGISYEGAVEKRDLSDLVESTGPAMEDTSSETTLEENTSVTNFTGEAHFLEQVEDSKDGVWLVEVLTKGRQISSLSDTSWLEFRKKMSRFGVNVGMFDCHLDRKFCSKKNWHNSHLILGLPQEFKTKAVVKLYSYEGHYRQQSIFNWIKETMSTKVFQIRSYEELKREWLKFNQTDSTAEIRMVMFSDIKNPPLFFSAVSIKFPGRVKFGFMNNKSLNMKDILKEFDWGIPPKYIVITAEKLSVYGNKPIENPTYKSMEVFLKTLYPSLNDIFVLSLGLCNFTSLFEPFLVQGSVLKRLFKFICCVLKNNTVLLLAWIILLTVFQLNTISFVIEFGLKCIRILGLSELGSYMRQDYCFYTAHKYFSGFSFIMYVSIVGILAYRFKDHEAEEFNPNEWNFSQFRTLEHLFFPTASLFLASQRRRFIDYEDAADETALGSFHSSMISTDYIRNLPIWNHRVLPIVSFLRGVSQDILLDSNLERTSSQGNSSNSQNSVASPEENSQEANQKGKQSNGACCGDGAEEIPESKPAMQMNEKMEKVETSDEKSKQNTDNANVAMSDPAMNFNKKHICDVDMKQNGILCGAPEGMLVETRCGICLDEYEMDVKLCGLPCGHCFHHVCIVAWLVKDTGNDNHFCPYCRWPSYKQKQSVHLHQE
ncbi:E3 ubiquitin-protein ligase RNF103-like [Mizuhopecten yessoensis]|uniref:E3 ubiquitin-protein ligase n=1 Tax=Mizuhopecten yessoensis TaxID=6573 RepID=A0A210PP50_MIZYE|nr:E3 ubiquitin-protein ligase RNF103-like [Mizuhopecten yessoensis]OWF38279.1 E3 ubiquitin-protein ligase [Mizuhopecten yessoensis]